MKAYKNYMDRIRLDEEQHGRLMEAVKAAEAAEAAKKAETQAEEPAKVRRFPLKRLAWIASAAAVIVLIVAVVPKNRLSFAPAEKDSVTEAYARDDAALEISKQADSNEMPQTQAPGAAQNAAASANSVPTTRQETIIEEFSHFSVVCGTAEYSLLQNYAGTIDPDHGQAQTTTKTAEEGADAYTVRTESALLLLQMKLGEWRSLMTDVPADEVSEISGEADPAESAEPEAPEESAACTEAAESTENAVLPDEAIAFEIGEDRFDYDSEKGLLSADGREYRLTEDEKQELNSLLESIFTDR